MKRICQALLFLFLVTGNKSAVAQDTQRVIDSLLTVLKTAKEDTSKLNTLIALAELYLENENLTRAEVIGEQCNSLADKLNVRSGWASVINLQGRIEMVKQRYLKAEENFKAALAIYQEMGDKKGVAISYCNIGRSYIDRGINSSEILRLNKEALKLFEETNDLHGQMDAYFNIGRVLNEDGHYPEALKNLFASLKLARELNDKDFIASCYMWIGSCFRHEGNYLEAHKYLIENLKIRTELKKKIRIADALTHLALNYESQGDYDTALETFYNGLNILDQNKYKVLTAFLFGHVGYILAQKGQYEEAMKYHQASLKNWEAVGHEGGIWLSCGQIGELLFKQSASLKPQEARSNYLEAIKYLNRGLALSPELKVHQTRKYIVRTLSDVYSALGDYKKGLEYYRAYVFIKDSLMNNETARILEQQRTQFEVEKAVNEEKIKQEEMLALQKAERKRKNELMIIGFGAFVLLSVFLTLFIRQRNNKKRAIERAEARNKMAELELQSLRAQLNPHFMFNSLNAIQELILMEDNERSHVYLSRFSKLIRMLLDNANQPFIPLKKELDFLDLYLSLEKLRIPDLEYRIETEPDIDANKTAVPNMMLQPYIENAIWHGLSPRQGDKKLLLKIHVSNGSIQYDIEDNGIGRQKAAEMKSLYRKEHKSKGMELLTKRFKLLNEEFGSEIKTDITDITHNGQVGGTRVSISVPKILSASIKETYV